jgi:phosphatidylglycerol lysyltransferase
MSRPGSSKRSDGSNTSDPERSDQTAQSRGAFPWRLAGVIVTLVVLGVALAALQRILRDVQPEDVLAAFSSVGPRDVLLCLLFTACSYLALTCYDALALSHLKLRVPYGRTALASFTSYAFVNNIGLAPLTAGSIRYRIYSVEGLTVPDIVALTAVCTLTFMLGAIAGLGGALVLEAGTLSAVNRLDATTNQVLGAGILGLLAAYLTWGGLKPRIMNLRGYSLALPGPRLSLAQISVALIDLLFAAAALYVLMPEALDIGFPAFAGVFVAALGLGLLSHTPGGVGIFEAAILLAFPDLPPEQVLGRLILFRCLYYLVPLAVAASMLALHEALHPSGVARRLADTAVASSSATPQVLGLAVMICGIVVLLTASLPVTRPPDQLIQLPWPVTEMGWLLSGISGMGLILFTRGLFRRLHRAWLFGLLSLAVAGTAVLMRGPDLRIAGIVFFAFFVLVAARRGFTRRARLRDQSYPVVWVGVVIASLGVSAWLGNLSHGAEGYGSGLLTVFGAEAEGGRAARALLAAALTAAAFFVLAQFTARAAIAATAPQRVRQLVRQSHDPEDWRALAPEMQHFTPQSVDAAIVYATRRRRWIALGDPLLATDKETQLPALVSLFRERVETRGAVPVFFDIGSTTLQPLEAIGFQAIEIGTRVVLDLDANAKIKPLPHEALRQMEFSYADTLADPQVRDELWQLETHLAQRLGADGAAPAFLYGPAPSSVPPRGSAVLLRRAGELVGCVRLFVGQTGDALIDRIMLARGPLSDAVLPILDQVASLLSERGMHTLSLGTLPPNARARAPYAPAMDQLTNAIGPRFYRHGLHFDTLDELRAFGMARNATRSPRYLAATDGAILPAALRDVAWLTLPGHRPAIEAIGPLSRIRTRLKRHSPRKGREGQTRTKD